MRSLSPTIAPAGPAGVAWGRVPFLLAGILSLFAGVPAGLARLGLNMPESAGALTGVHGPLMISGFFGTLIALERAVAVGRPWAYLGPALSGLGGIALATGLPEPTAGWLFVAAGLALTGESILLYARQPALFTAIMAAGACTWTAGNLIWAGGRPPAEAAGAWICFFVLTIAAERLELTRFLPPRPGATPAFLIATAVLLVGTIVRDDSLVGLGLVSIALWLAVCDIARRTIHGEGLPRFTAACLLSGYAWLAAAGLVIIRGLLEPGDPAYDAGLHALFLGFVFAMVFGHAPIIFPAILRVTIPYHPVFYLPLVVLDLSLAGRWVGDYADLSTLRLAGAVGNGIAIALFLVLTAWRALTATEPDK